MCHPSPLTRYPFVIILDLQTKVIDFIRKYNMKRLEHERREDEETDQGGGSGGYGDIGGG